MRLWHYKLIKYLPRQQLVAQWRELNSIFAKQDNHILINYLYEYDKNDLINYTHLVLEEFSSRGYHINSFSKFLTNDKTVSPFPLEFTPFFLCLPGFITV